jgi:hypothetical protein
MIISLFSFFVLFLEQPLLYGMQANKPNEAAAVGRNPQNYRWRLRCV